MARGFLGIGLGGCGLMFLGCPLAAAMSRSATPSGRPCSAGRLMGRSGEPPIWPPSPYTSRERHRPAPGHARAALGPARAPTHPPRAGSRAAHPRRLTHDRAAALVALDSAGRSVRGHGTTPPAAGSAQLRWPGCPGRMPRSAVGAGLALSVRSCWSVLALRGSVGQRQRLAGGDLPGHIHQPPARGAGRPP
jgi:hypothetical protein